MASPGSEGTGDADIDADAYVDADAEEEAVLGLDSRLLGLTFAGRFNSVICCSRASSGKRFRLAIASVSDFNWL